MIDPQRILEDLAGSFAGELRLDPLTRDRAKPAVPFGGRYRIVDFVLSNFANSGVLRMKVLTQYKSDSLNTHIMRAWRLAPILNQYVDLVPAQMRTGPEWYKGSADAIYQNINLITVEEPDHVFVFGSDHIYRMDVQQMLDFHKEVGAECTVAAIPMPSDVPAPPRFSTTNVCPICLPTCSNTVRAVISVALPAVNGTMILIGCFAGHSCAGALSGASAINAMKRRAAR